MPANQLDFRAACGSFAFTLAVLLGKRIPLPAVKRVSPSRVGGVMFGFTLCYLFWGSLLLQRCGDVEMNPGPLGDTAKASKVATRQSTLLSSGSSSKLDLASPGERRTSSSGANGSGGGAGITNEVFMKQMEAMRLSIQKTIETSANESNQKVDNLATEVRQMKEQFSTLNNDVNNLRDEVQSLRDENSTLAQENDQLRACCKELFYKTDDLECRSKRNNLIFYGIQRDENETSDDCEEKVKTLLTDDLGLPTIPFDRVHRTSMKKDAPIVARCTFYKDRQTILKAKKNLSETNKDISIGEDFSERVRAIRKSLLPHYKAAKKDKKKAGMIYDHLLIDGKKLYLDDKGNLVEDDYRKQRLL